MIRTTLPVALFVAATTLACSSNTTIVNANCGPGTTLVDGACVAADASPGDSTTTADSEPADAAAADGADGSADAPPSDALSPGDDPCPTLLGDGGLGGAEFVNCSYQCAPRSESKCAPAECAIWGVIRVTQPPPSALSTIIRTPSKPGVHPQCKVHCPSGKTVYALNIDVNIEGLRVGEYRVTVGPPWRIVERGLMSTFCSGTGPGTYASCAVPKGEAFYVVTADPNAPARNIRIEKISSSGGCP